MAELIASFIALAIMGLANSSYLAWQHFKKSKQPLVCPLNHDCSKVTESRWAHILFIRNEQLGLLFYTTMAAAAAAIAITPSNATAIQTFLLLSTGAGLLISAFFVFVQLRIIKDYCFYCMASALITALMFLNSIMLIG